MTWARRGESSAVAPFESFGDLVARHDAVIFDLEGTLVRAGRPAPGAIAATTSLTRAGKPWVVATNDASRSPEHIADELAAMGLTLAPSSIFTSGSLIGPLLVRRGLLATPCLVLGPPICHDAVARVGGLAVPPALADASCAVIVLADETGFELADGLETALGLVALRARRHMTTRLILPNADVVIPLQHTDARLKPWALGAGAYARLIRDAARHVSARRSLVVHVLGKPRPPLFLAALSELRRRSAAPLETGRVVMFGDRLETDMVGARSLGLTAALVGVETGGSARSGIRREAKPAQRIGNARPFVVTDLSWAAR